MLSQQQVIDFVGMVVMLVELCKVYDFVVEDCDNDNDFGLINVSFVCMKIECVCWLLCVLLFLSWSQENVNIIVGLIGRN